MKPLYLSPKDLTEQKKDTENPTIVDFKDEIFKKICMSDLVIFVSSRREQIVLKDRTDKSSEILEGPNQMVDT